ncbi:interleukin-12 receptor subunit beta-1-like, partial [Meleagris gallopavo]|uniref:interleukin-12 receptor subunit beta-1-like n=1 Tax=Meleagris gallopavo TaxID=9103 RepID=UPI00093CD0A9
MTPGQAIFTTPSPHEPGCDSLHTGAPDPPPGLSCFRRCSSGPFTCSWPPQGPAGITTYVLVLCYVSRQLCQQHDAGTATVRTLTQHKVYVRTNATAWVEARWEQHLERSPNITLHLDEAGECREPGGA